MAGRSLMPTRWSSIEIVFSGDGGSVSEEALARFDALLASLHAVVSGRPVEGPPRYGVRLSVEAESPEAAITTGVDHVRAAATEAGLPDWPVVHVDCMTEDELDRSIEQPPVPELVGVSEIARLLAEDGAAVTRQRASAITRRGDFPEPVARLASGPVWTRDSVRNFVESWERKPGRPANESAVDWALLSDAPPDGVLVVGLAFLVGAGLVALARKQDSFTARLREPVSRLPADAPEEAARVLDFTKKFAERDQALRLPRDMGTRIERRARAAR